MNTRITGSGKQMREQADAEQEFVDFARLHSDWLFRTALAITADWHHAQDLTQTTMAKIFVAWSRVRSAESPRAYARGVLIKAWLSDRRRRSSHEVPTAEMDAGSVADFAESVAVIETLRALEPRDRAVLVLRFIEGRSVEQTARDLGMSRSAVSTATPRALSRARALFEEPAVPDDGGRAK
jgi:RNA polymerase sigma factor (sigma-70 family)